MTASRHVILSGGSRGLGVEFAQALLGAGYRVSSFSRSRSDQSDALAQAHPDSFRFAEVDISDESAVGEFVSQATLEFGVPWGVINNAGIARDGVLASSPMADIKTVVSINLLGALYLTRHCARKMLLKREGRILNVTSIVSQRGFSGLSVYSSTKAGMDASTRSLARELGPAGITVNSIAPGFLHTDMTAELSDEQRQQIVRRTPLGRLGVPSDCVPLLLFLLSDASSFISGQVIAVDGGSTA